MGDRLKRNENRGRGLRQALYKDSVGVVIHGEPPALGRYCSVEGCGERIGAKNQTGLCHRCGNRTRWQAKNSDTTKVCGCGLKLSVSNKTGLCISCAMRKGKAEGSLGRPATTRCCSGCGARIETRNKSGRCRTCFNSHQALKSAVPTVKGNLTVPVIKENLTTELVTKQISLPEKAHRSRVHVPPPKIQRLKEKKLPGKYVDGRLKDQHFDKWRGK